jgi:hypothetical protein
MPHDPGAFNTAMSTLVRFRQGWLGAVIDTSHNIEEFRIMLTDRAHAERLSRQWGVGADDVLLIALNACGMRADIGVSPAEVPASAGLPA